MSYRITTDSTSDLPHSYMQEKDIACIGLSFQLNNIEYTESPDLELTPKEFYDALRNQGTSSTVQINTYSFIEFIEPFLQQGDDVLHLAFSSGLSGTYASCERGAEELREKYPDRKIIVIDTLAASLGEGLLVHHAYLNKMNGMSLEENAQWLENNKLHLCHWFTVDDLMFLHRGGRVSKTSAIFGSLLGIKPILHVDDEGHLILMSKSRGRQGSIDTLVEKIKTLSFPNLKDQPVFISHGDCLEDAQKLATLIEEKTGAKITLINYIGTVIGSHSGPGTIALFFMGEKR